VGLLDGRENIIAAGWIGGESIHDDPEHDNRLFTVFGLQWWLSQISTYPATLSMVAGTPDAWGEMAALNVDRALWHLLHWRTTVTAIADFYPTDDTRYAKTMDAQGESLWQQLLSLSLDHIFAKPIVDRYGRLFVDVPHNLRPLADRSDSEEIMTLAAEDHEKTLDVAKASPRAGQVNLASTLVESTGSSSTLYSLSPGHIPNYQGRAELLDRILAATQDEANSLAGLVLGDRMNEWPEFPIELSGNNRAFGLAPRQYASVTLDAHTGKLLPRRIEYKFNPRDGKLTVSIIFTGETFEQNSVNGDIPDGTGGFVDIPNLPPLPPLPPIPMPIGLPGDGNAPDVVVVFVPGKGFWYTDEFSESSPRWWSWNWGLDAVKIASDYYVNIDVSHIGGRGFVHTNGDNPEVWSALSPGSKWELVADSELWQQYKYVYGGYDSTFTGCTMAVNRGASDQVLIIGMHHYGSQEGPTHVFLGSSSGLDHTLEIDDGDIYNHEGGGQGVYGAGKWLTVWRQWDKTIFRLPFGAGSFSDYSSAVALGGGNAVIARGGVGGNAAVSWGEDGTQVTDDNGDTWTFIPTTTLDPLSGVLNSFLMSIAIDPTGQYLAAFTTDLVNLRVSSDGGTIWSQPSGWTGAGQVVENCGDTERWIMQAMNGIYYTGDTFTTWVDKTGDLREKTDMVINFEATQIRYIR